MLTIIKEIGGGASAIIAIVTCITLLIEPLRNKILGISVQKEALKCLLRNEIIHIYYKNLDKKELRQFEYESVMYLCKAYKALKGNSFVDKIYSEIKDEWKIIT